MDTKAAPEVEKLARQIYWSANTRMMALGVLDHPRPWRQAEPERRRLCRTVAEHAITFIVARP